MTAEPLIPELQAAFQGLMQNAPARDPACKASIAIVKALIGMDVSAAEIYFAGLKHVQKEGSFGPPVDVAAPLRGLCARGLARTGHTEALYEIVNLLVDPEIPARVGAVQALAETGRQEGELLLRLKLLQGDDEEVVCACFTGLLDMAPRNSMEFVARFLKSDSAGLREGAALALGESRLPGVLPLLQEAYAVHRQLAFRRGLLLSIALLRQDEGVEFLLSRLEKEPEPLAAAALEALNLYSGDESIRARVERIVSGRKKNA
jgi:HEAT repeat protein